MKMCLHQFIRPRIAPRLEGAGDCSVCKKDEQNKQCRAYTPIEVKTYEVEK